MTAVIKAKVERARRIGLLPMFMAALVVALMGSAVYLTVATAVHDEGVFQLDGDARLNDTAYPPGTVPPSPPPAPEEWDEICKAHAAGNIGGLPVTCTFAPLYTPPAGNTTAEDHQFVTEIDPDNILTGGGTKDDLDIPNWKWKTASPSPDKNDLQHAFAAKYSTATEKFIYFGADRISNNGNANIAFWFFQNQVGAPGEGGAADLTCETASGCQFTGTHVANSGTCPGPTCVRGDLLIVSAFTGGGTQPNIAVYEWYGKGNAPAALCANSECSLATIATGGGAPCATAPASDPACAIVNGLDCEGPTPTGKTKAGDCTSGSPGTVSPWTFQDKGGLAPNLFAPGEFFEGGLNLTELGFGDVCISSFLVNTRSSQSVDSVLHDFALGDLGGCTSSTVTTPKDGSGAAIPPGGLTIPAAPTSSSLAVRDSATVTVTGISTWSGTVEFFLCGPIAVASTCATGGTSIGSVPVTQATAMPILSAAAFVSEANTFVGGVATTHYCWRAVFSGDAAKGVPGSQDASATECFVVNPRQSTLDTAAVASPVDFGQPVQDNATLGNTANKPGTGGTAPYPSINPTTPGAAAGGTITFTLYKADCTTLATGTGTNPQNVAVSGNGVYGPVSFTPDAPGTYHWKASYSGDLPNTLASTHNATCTDADETVIVRRQLPSIATEQRFLPNDRATVSIVSTTNLAGSVFFELFLNTSTCAGTPVYTETIAVSGASPQTTAWTNNTANFVTSSQSVSWRVTYTSTNTGHKDIPATCHENSSLTITNGSPVQAPPD